MRDNAGAHSGKAYAPATLLALAALALPAAASAQEPAAPLMTPAAASAQLDQAVEALGAHDAEAVEATDELRHLAIALPYLEGRELRRARSVLARPPSTDNDIEPFGAEWTQVATQTEQTYLSPSGNFLIHWVTSPNGGDAPDLTDSGGAPGVPDYVELVAAFADFSETVENDNLGWPQPRSDGGKGGGGAGLTDIYLSDICDPNGGCVFGYAAPDDPRRRCLGPPFRCFAFLVLDNDYSFAEFGYPDPEIPLKVTLAHEYNHVLQFGIDTIQDGWMFESTAVWMEEQVFPFADDWLFYVGVWTNQPGAPITKFGAQGGLRVYGSAVWNHFLESGYGSDVVLASWLRSRDSTPKDYAVGAYDLGIRHNGGPGFAKEFAKFAAATAEWRTSPGRFSGDDGDESEFEDVDREGSLRRGGRTKRVVLDHTAFRLLRARPRQADALRLRVRAPDNVRTGIALVGREGDELGGTVTTAITYLSGGGRGKVRLPNAQSFDRITAVVANADGRVNGFGTFDWRYTRDNERFRLRLR